MEEKINIAKILKDKPVGLKLYSNTFGYISFNVVHKDKIYFLSEDDYTHSVKSNGKMYDDGECVIFPSKEMRDWEKFSWKKGDVLAGAFGALCIFDKWANDDYTRFDAKFVTPKSRGTTFEVEDWCKITNEACIRQYIRDIEEDNGGKLNLTTLEVEKHQYEFKDGDIVFMKGIKGRCFANCIFILRSEYKDGDERAFYYAFYNADDKYTLDEYGNTKVHYSLRLATDSEKQQLFEALAKKNKRWDAEKKQIVDLKPKIELKPFDKVLSRRCSEDYWVLNFYSHKSHKTGYHICIDGSSNLYCIPYNEETAHLLGTTDEWKGGEG
jgi:hypothetical protein